MTWLSKTMILGGWIFGWMDGWVGAWVEVKAVLSNKKAITNVMSPIKASKSKNLNFQELLIFLM